MGMRNSAVVFQNKALLLGTVPRGAQRQAAVRDWPLITGTVGGGGGPTRCEVLLLRKGGAEKVLSMLKGGGGHNKFWGSFYTVAWKF